MHSGTHCFVQHELGAVVVLLWRRYMCPSENAGTIAATGTTPHTATTGCSLLCPTRFTGAVAATGAKKGRLPYLGRCHCPVCFYVAFLNACAPAFFCQPLLGKVGVVGR